MKGPILKTLINQPQFKPGLLLDREGSLLTESSLRSLFLAVKQAATL